MELYQSSPSASEHLVRRTMSADPLLYQSQESEADTSQFSEETMLVSVDRSVGSSTGYGTTDSYANPRGSWESDDAPLLEEVKGGGSSRCVYCCKSCTAVIKDKLQVLNSPTAKAVLGHIKVAVLFILTAIFAAHPEEHVYVHQVSVSQDRSHEINITDASQALPIVKLYVTSSFLFKLPNEDTQNVTFRIYNPASNTSYTWKKVLPDDDDDIDVIPENQDKDKFDFEGDEFDGPLILNVSSTTTYSAPVAVGILALSTEVNNEVLYAAIIMVFVYVLIIFELIHRTLAAMLGGLAAMAVLASLNMKPSLTRVLAWVDYETLCLLFGMMVLVAIFCESGFFDWAALAAYKLAKGKTWPLITILCIFSAVISAFLDNVTTILLLTPVCIRLCEVLELDPKHILIALVMFSNVGGTATAIGDPPNVIIVANGDLQNETEDKLNFATFTLHMTLGTLFVIVGCYILLRLMYRKKELLKAKDPPEVAEIKHEIEIWQRTCNKIVVASRQEEAVRELLLQKIDTLENLAETRRKKHKENTKPLDFTAHVEELEQKYVIKDWVLLIKSLIVLSAVISCFFIHSFVPQIYLSVGWIAVLGAIWLLVLSDYSDLESVLDRIEWATLLFFAALFVMMEAMNELGLIDWIATETTKIIEGIDESARLTVAIIIIIWISALASCFIDNIPFTTAMLPVIIQLGQNEELGLDVEPLVFALAFGACLGGNGTLVGASANIVCAGIAETHGHGFTFWEFFKVGFPMMLVSVVIAMCYLLICHVAFDWVL